MAHGSGVGHGGGKCVGKEGGMVAWCTVGHAGGGLQR